MQAPQTITDIENPEEQAHCTQPVELVFEDLTETAWHSTGTEHINGILSTILPSHIFEILKMLLFTSILFQIKKVDKLKTAGQNTGKTIPMTTETAIWRLDSSLSFTKLASVFFGL